MTELWERCSGNVALGTLLWERGAAAAPAPPVIRGSLPALGANPAHNVSSALTTAPLCPGRRAGGARTCPHSPPLSPDTPRTTRRRWRRWGAGETLVVVVVMVVVVVVRLIFYSLIWSGLD